MAVIRVKHTGTASDGTTWAAAYTTLVAALAVAVSGDVVWVSSTHAGTYATSQTINAASGASVAIKCVTESGASGSSGLATGATETLTANATSFTIQSANSQHLFIHGVTFVTHTGSSASNQILIGQIAANSTLECRSCTFTTIGTSASSFIRVGGGTSATTYAPEIRLLSCTFNLRNAAGSSVPALILGQGDIEIISPTIGYSGGTKPLLCFGTNVNVGSYKIRITGDLSGYDASGGLLFSVTNFGGGLVEFKDCSIHGTPTFIGGTFASNSFEVYAINVDSGDTKTVFEYRTRLGTIVESDSTIYANDGLTIKGTNVSWRIDTTADCSEAQPFCLPPILKAHSGTSAITADVEFVHDSATDLTDRNIWSVTSYVSSASYPQGAITTNQNADPFEGTAVDHANTSITWTGTGGFGNVNKQQLRNSLTPAEACVLETKVYIGATSKTLYLDPTLRIT